MDNLDAAAQPRCPDCGALMRDDPNGFKCPACGRIEDHSAEYAQIEMPPEFDGPSFEDHKRAHGG